MLRSTPFLVAILLIGWPSPARAQLGTLVSPGPLSKAHAALSGVENCVKCHEPGKRVTAQLCLACHKPVAERIARKKGVHRDVAGDCVGCHVEHAGRDGELRPFDTRAFDHRAETGFPLEGRHAPIAGDCAKCHRASGKRACPLKSGRKICAWCCQLHQLNYSDCPTTCFSSLPPAVRGRS